MIYTLLIVLLVIFQLFYFYIARKFNIIDKPNERSSHQHITLLGGGVSFYAAILLFFILSGFLYPWFFIGVTTISVISFIDDINPVSSKLRLVFHLAAVLLLFYQLNVYIFPWYIIPIILIVAVGILNAYNFMDGINGMTGMYNLVVLGGLWYIDHYVVDFTDADLIGILLIAILIFGFFNFRKKAKCFAGDVGAFTVAFAVIFLIGSLIIKTNNFAYIGILAVYGVDTVLTIFHRICLKENIFLAHRKHLFQLLVNELKFPHLTISLIYAVVQVVVIIGLLVFIDNAFLYLSCVIIILSLLYYFIKKSCFHLYQNPFKKQH